MGNGDVSAMERQRRGREGPQLCCAERGLDGEVLRQLYRAKFDIAPVSGCFSWLS
jgi:hypothetical protein